MADRIFYRAGRVSAACTLGLMLAGGGCARAVGGDAHPTASDGVGPAVAAASEEATIRLAAAEATATLGVEKVRIGMKGYGLTVFSGTEVEPFPVEVISIVRNESPGRDVIWIRCPSERMQRTGPVQGMSGSPIYLWPETAPPEAPATPEPAASAQPPAPAQAGEADHAQAPAPVQGEPISEGPDAAAGTQDTGEISDNANAPAHVPEGHSLGKGGQLIGAFAFGFSNSKGCLVGVQPIGYMREVATRVGDQPENGPGEGGSRRVQGGSAKRTLSRLRQLARQSTSVHGELYLDAFAKLAGPGGPVSSPAGSGSGRGNARTRTGVAARRSRPADRPAAPAPRSLPGDTPTRVQPLMLPMSVGSPALARAAAPLLALGGVEPVADQGLISGPPPPSVRTDQAALKPGGVLAIPLVFGDVSMAAAGTVTDVTDAGTVLGFGHAMFGRGNVALPMATGYVHFIVPRRTTSFKTAAGLNLRGSLVQDEASGVAGLGKRRYKTAPVHVAVQMPDADLREYQYSVVHHPMLTPTLAPMVVQRSITAVHGLPRRNTVRVKGALHFTGDRTIPIDAMLSDASASGVMMELVPAISLMMQNRHQRLELTRADLRVEVERGIQQATLADARLSEVEVAPGQTITATLRIQPYGKAIKRREVTFTVPEDIPVGDYQLVLSDAPGYLQRYLKNRPYLLKTTNIDELQATLEKILGVKRDAIYLTLQLKEKGVAIGRSELPQLPSSRQAMLSSPTSTTAIPFKESVEKVFQSPYVTQGELKFRLHVRKPGRAEER